MGKKKKKKKQYICHPVPTSIQDRGQKLPAPSPQAQMVIVYSKRCIGRTSGLSPLIPGLLMIKEEDGGGEVDAQARELEIHPPPLKFGLLPHGAYKAENQSLYPLQGSPGYQSPRPWVEGCWR